jgi:hypothetical protein
MSGSYVGDEGEQHGAEGDQDHPGRDQPSGAREVAEDPHREAGEHQGNVGGDGLRQQRRRRKQEVGHGRVIIIGPCNKGRSQT